MGVFLDKPKKEKESDSGEGNGLRYALCSMQGWRIEMEDAHAVRIGLSPNLKDSSYFAVFDGHAGDFVSKYSSEHLIETILDLWLTEDGKNIGSKSGNESEQLLIDSTELEKFKEKIVEGFLKIDSNMRDLPTLKSGTTAVASFVTPNKIIFANCGDSRALLCSNKDIKFVTSDHKPYNDEEKKRIENAGGSVMIQRVNGSLAVSRALGDYDYKSATDLPPTKQLVSAEPDLKVIERCDEDEFLILACDGVWDVMTNEDVVGYIRSRLLVHTDLKIICEELLETCLAKGSRDNMSVILVTFPSAPGVSEEAIKLEAELDARIKEEVTAYVHGKGEETSLSMVCDMLQSSDIPNLPPGGGIHSKLPLIEQTLDDLLPNREEHGGGTGMLNSLPVPFSMLRQLAQEREGGGIDVEAPDDE